MTGVLTGLDHLAEKHWRRLKGLRLGLLANQASVDRQLRPAAEVIARLLPEQLKALFGPQHGFGAIDQDNMVETPHAVDENLGIPIYSLYSGDLKPAPRMLEGIDALIVDLQDVGTRVYTFAATLLNCLQAAAEQGKTVFVLDRPNPLGGERMEGNLLDPALYSFVGPYRFPMRHGLTMGEMARVFDRAFELRCRLEVIPLVNWQRCMGWRETGRRWVLPSPNMPLAATAQVYPGQVIWEGTNVSEGRGTCRPFEIFGAPYWKPRAIERALDPRAKSGCQLQEFEFRPMFQKWQGEVCRGFLIHVTDPRAYRPFATTLCLLQAVLELYPAHFCWREPPYEYEFEKLPVDLILGDRKLRERLEAGEKVSTLEEEWAEQLRSYDQWRKPFLLYG